MLIGEVPLMIMHDTVLFLIMCYERDIGSDNAIHSQSTSMAALSNYISFHEKFPEGITMPVARCKGKSWNNHGADQTYLHKCI